MSRNDTPVRIAPPGKGASVLIPLLQVRGEWNILFEVRNPGITQGGEICFPGGRVEPGEKPSDAAVRETQEELLGGAVKVMQAVVMDFEALTEAEAQRVGTEET